MRQVRITTKNIDYPSDNDCFIPEDDPIHAIKKANMLGGLGMEKIIDDYTRTLPKIETNNKGKEASEKGLKPGTEEWFKHWFGDKR
jgi:hypothetical protein